MKIMLINEKTDHVIETFNQLKRRYHHVQIVNVTEDEQYAARQAGEYVLYRLAGVRKRPATTLNDLPFATDYAMAYTPQGELRVTDMGQEIATLQLIDWQKQTVRAVKYMAAGANWQFDLVGERAEVIKRWIRDERLRTIMIRLTQSNGKLVKKLYNYDGDSQQPVSLSFLYDGKLYANETDYLTKACQDIFDTQDIEILRYLG